MELDEYRQKRNFGVTPEPDGESADSAQADKTGLPETADEWDSLGNRLVSGGFKRLSFVVQHHLSSRAHYDFRLERHGALVSWAVPKGPSVNPADKRLAVRVEDHPLDYRNFEGVIPKGEYGGGTVMLWDEGFWVPLGDATEGFEGGAVKFALFGRRLRGLWTLVRLKNRENDKGENWLLIKEQDGYAKDGDVLSEYPVSVRTGRTMEEIARQ